MDWEQGVDDFRMIQAFHDTVVTTYYHRTLLVTTIKALVLERAETA